VVANVIAGVEKSVESDLMGRAADTRALHVRMLGPMTISRDGQPLTLPSSRKVRALIAYLALAPGAVTRSKLCELLWDVPNDPRGELRWCLSKVRSILDEPGRRRVLTHDDAIELDLADCFVDAIEIARTTQKGIQTVAPERLRAQCMLFAGDFLDGLEIDRSPQFNGWLIAERRRFRGCHVALLEHLAGSAPGNEAFGYLEKWLQLAPFDRRVHEILLDAFGRGGRIGEGEEHLAVTIRHFEAEGLDSTPIRDAWRAARARAGRAPMVRAVSLPPAAPAPLPSSPVEIATARPSRASVAVMPFVDRTAASGTQSASADGLVHDVITRLAKLRSLFVIARGTVFALHDRSVSPQEAGRTLNVDYVVSGSLQRRDNRLVVTVELAESRSARIVWTEVFDRKLDDAFLVLDEIGNRIVASIASEIETAERNRAILKPPSSLDAWEAYHRGLWHMYRFNRADNDRARHFFDVAIRLDPTFARAHAGLSFTHWQNAFQGWEKRELETERAFEAAGQSLMVDDRDPGAHWAMGRALWLRGNQDQSIIELECAVDLSPNFALGHYALAFVHAQGGDAQVAVTLSDHSRLLSPFDPMLFAMLGARAIALARLERFDEAADWAVKAAARPNAHAHIRAIAACCLALAGRCDEAGVLVTSIQKTIPHYRVDDFLAAFQFEPQGAALFRKAAKRIGMA
jgi:TolB-like protein/DNA-binding SARP family transcriptional activator